MNRTEAEMVASASNMKLGVNAERVLLGIQRKKGHCPCEVTKTNENVCPCYTFRHDSKCKCGLFVEE